MIDELRTFMRVVELESFTKAAESLHLSQPSVSVHIRRLEEQFETKLIKRSNKEKSIVITATGNILYKRAEEMLKLIEVTEDEIHDLQETLSGKLKIGASFTIGEYILPKFLGEMSEHYPELTCNVNIGNTEEICRQVEALILDLGLIEGTVCSKDLLAYEFATDEMLLVASPKHTWVDFDTDQLQNSVWISREEGSGTSATLHKFLHHYKITPKRIMRMGSNYAVKEAVIHGLGLTLISESIVQEDIERGRLQKIELPIKIERTLTCITNKGMHKSRLKDVFMKELIGDKEF